MFVKYNWVCSNTPITFSMFVKYITGRWAEVIIIEIVFVIVLVFESIKFFKAFFDVKRQTYKECLFGLDN
jgi:hypothetical protein